MGTGNTRQEQPSPAGTRPQITLGQYTLASNPDPTTAEIETLHAIKSVAAEFIDLVDQIPDGSNYAPARERLKELAMNDIESAAMWAVKAATKRKP